MPWSLRSYHLLWALPIVNRVGVDHPRSPSATQPPGLEDVAPDLSVKGRSTAGPTFSLERISTGVVLMEYLPLFSRAFLNCDKFSFNLGLLNRVLKNVCLFFLCLLLTSVSIAFPVVFHEST